MKNTGTSPRILEFSGVRFTGEYLCCMQDGRRKDLTNRSELRRIVLRYGAQAPRPITQFTLGACMLPFIVLPLYHAYEFFMYGGTIFGKEAYLGAFSLLGGWLMYDAIKKCCRKLPFTSVSTTPELSAFLERVRHELRYEIRTQDLSRTV